MNCTQVGPLLSELLDGELPDETRVAAEAHLEACGECAREFRALRRTVRFVRGRASVAMTAGTPGGIYEEFNRAIADPASNADPMAVMLNGLLGNRRDEPKGEER